MITAAVLQELGASWRNAAQYVAPLQAAADRYEITTPRRVACWLGQLAHESAKFSRESKKASGSEFEFCDKGQSGKHITALRAHAALLWSVRRDQQRRSCRR
jgi:predicted chitinase